MMMTKAIDMSKDISASDLEIARALYEAKAEQASRESTEKVRCFAWPVETAPGGKVMALVVRDGRKGQVWGPYPDHEPIVHDLERVLLGRSADDDPWD